MKRLIKLTIILLVMLTGVSTISAKENSISGEPKVIYKQDEITDMDALEQRARNGISDKVPFTPVELATNNNIMNNKQVLIKTHATTQKLKTILYNNNETIDTFATTIFTEGEEVIDDDPNATVLNGSWDQYEDIDGPSKFVKSYSTIYWELRGSGTSREFRLTRAAGGWSLLDGTASMTNRVVRLGQAPSRTIEYRPTTNTFSYNAPSSWGWLNANSEMNFLGATTEITVTRGTYSTKQVLPNIIYGYPSRY